MVLIISKYNELTNVQPYNHKSKFRFLEIFLKDVKYNSQFNADFFEIEATEFFLEIAAVIDSKGRGYTYYTLGAGVNGSDGGAGGSHATAGGSRYDLKLNNNYGSLYNPVSPGSRGGMGSNGLLGGRGGGKMRIKVGHSFVLDGVINVDSDNAPERSGMANIIYMVLLRVT